MVPKLVEPGLDCRSSFAEAVYEPRQVLDDGSGESQGVEDAELLDECGRTVVARAIMALLRRVIGRPCWCQRWSERFGRTDSTLGTVSSLSGRSRLLADHSRSSRQNRLRE